jgi:hypothetical protein
MAIDGKSIRDPGKQPEPREDGTWITVLAWAAVLVPFALLVWGTYLIGTWTGGTIGGVLSVASTVAIGIVIWAYRRSRPH